MRIGERRFVHAWIERMNRREAVRRSAPESMPTIAS
jgi:hypothetical protein